MKAGNLELEDKAVRLEQMIAVEGLDGVLLNTQHNFSWLTCGGSNGIDMTRENGAGFLFVTRKGRRYLIANNIEMPRLIAEELPDFGEFEPIEISWHAEKSPQTVLDTARSLSGGTNFGCDIGFPGTNWIEPSIAACRYELTSEEIDRYRQLGRHIGQALEHVVPQLAPGQTEKQVARIVRDALHAFDCFPVVTLVGGDERIGKYRHPVPTENVWTSTLLIVVCSRRHGLIASASRMIYSGDVPADLQRRTEACAAVNASVYAATRIGATGSELYKAAAEAYAAQGFAGEIAKHHQGGAAGYRTRDWVAHPDSRDIVRPNQAFAWNPSITGTKTEETAIVIDGQLEVITSSPGFPTIVSVVDGRAYSSPGILSLLKGASA